MLINELHAPTLYVEHEKALQVPDELADRLSVLLRCQALDNAARAQIRAFCKPSSYKSFASTTV